jgi:phospholipid/cholesterol/gamma-HCH transport system substrate-binding protein
MKNSTVETLMGAFVVVVALGFLLFAYNSSGRTAQSGGYKITADFDNVEGLNMGSDVRMAGIRIGSVIGQRLNPENFQAQIVMSIDPTVKLAEDTSAKITAEGLLGSKFVALEPGGSETLLADGGIISYTQGAIDIWSLISQAMFDKTGAKPPATTEQAPAQPQGAPPPDATTPDTAQPQQSQ